MSQLIAESALDGWIVLAEPSTTPRCSFGSDCAAAAFVPFSWWCGFRVRFGALWMALAPSLISRVRDKRLIADSCGGVVPGCGT